MNIGFRVATASELPLLFDLINESYLPDDSFFLEGPRIGKLEDLNDFLLRGPLHVFTNEETQEIIGCVHLASSGGVEKNQKAEEKERAEEEEEGRKKKEEEKEEEKKMSMGLLTVRQSLKKGGLAAKFASICHDYAKKTGHVAMKIHVVSVKPWLVALYQKIGYHVTGEAPWEGEHVVLTQPCHFVLMEKRLE